MASLLTIEIAIHYCRTPTQAGDYGVSEGREAAPAVKEARERLEKAGLLRFIARPPEHPRNYEATDGCHVWLKALCAVPFPVQQWVIPTKEHR